MKKPNNKLFIIKRYLIFSLPAILFFSYYPLITLGSDRLMNFELSLPLIWLFLFSVISLPSILLFLRTDFRKRKRAIIISLLFPFYSSLTIFWSLNPLRTLLTSGVMWCIWLSIVSIYDFHKKTKEPTKNTLLRVFYVSTIIVCVVCWLQCVLDVIGVPRETTLLCPGCTNYSFGFPHPNGFAIEPQFMGNLLLMPAFLSFYRLMNISQKQQKNTLIISTFIILATLFLTMSRGAIYAFFVGFIIFLIFAIKNKKTLRPMLLIPFIIITSLFTLVFQGIFAEISPTNDTFKSGISKVLNQMSLGIVDIPYDLKTNNEAEAEKNNSQFDGYAEISTTTRLDFQKLAFKTWTSSPTNFIFGVGTGSAGRAMHATSPEASGEKEIVQNEILEIAVELGLIGIIILVVTIIALIKFILKSPYKDLLFPLLGAYFISYLFFSGLPNALHIYLLPAIASANRK